MKGEENIRHARKQNKNVQSVFVNNGVVSVYHAAVLCAPRELHVQAHLTAHVALKSVCDLNAGTRGGVAYISLQERLEQWPQRVEVLNRLR